MATAEDEGDGIFNTGTAEHLSEDTPNAFLGHGLGTSYFQFSITWVSMNFAIARLALDF